jgi:hypothetical protein
MAIFGTQQSGVLDWRTGRSCFSAYLHGVVEILVPATIAYLSSHHDGGNKYSSKDCLHELHDTVLLVTVEDLQRFSITSNKTPKSGPRLRTAFYAVWLGSMARRGPSTESPSREVALQHIQPPCYSDVARIRTGVGQMQDQIRGVDDIVNTRAPRAFIYTSNITMLIHHSLPHYVNPSAITHR